MDSSLKVTACLTYLYDDDTISQQSSTANEEEEKQKQLVVVKKITQYKFTLREQIYTPKKHHHLERSSDHTLLPHHPLTGKEPHSCPPKRSRPTWTQESMFL